MTYHKAKMEEINKIVKELWIKTYKGQGLGFFKQEKKKREKKRRKKKCEAE